MSTEPYACSGKIPMPAAFPALTSISCVFLLANFLLKTEKVPNQDSSFLISSSNGPQNIKVNVHGVLQALWELSGGIKTQKTSSGGKQRDGPKARRSRTG